MIGVRGGRGELGRARGAEGLAAAEGRRENPSIIEEYEL